MSAPDKIWVQYLDRHKWRAANMIGYAHAEPDKNGGWVEYALVTAPEPEQSPPVDAKPHDP